MSLLFATSSSFAQALFLEGNGTAGSQFGSAVCRTIDFDGDGQPDLIIGSPGANNSTGAISVVSSATGNTVMTMVGTGPLARFGASLIRLTDLNGDTIPELAVGAPGAGNPTPAGAIRILDGATLSQISSLPGPTAQARLGTRLASLGDVNGDGFPDFAASAPGFDNGAILETGAVIIFDGVSGATLRTIPGQAPFDGYGEGLGVIDDLNGDGIHEVVIGAPGFDPVGIPGAGLVEVVDPKTGSPIWSIPGTSPNASLGASCDGLLDVDGDLIPDLIGGAPSDSSSGVTFGGSCTIYSGASGQVLNGVAGQSLSDRLGFTVAGVGDLNNDGRGDYACGSPFVTGLLGANMGQLTIYSGMTHTLLYQYNGIDTKSALGSSCRVLGDLDGDNRDEFAIGSPLFDLPISGNDAGRLQIFSTLKGDISVDSTGQFGSPYVFTLRATPNSLAFLMVDPVSGLVQSNFGEICLGLSVGFTIVAIPMTNSLGISAFGGNLPAGGVPPNTTLFFQGLVADRNSFSGVRTTNCSSLTLIP